MVSTTSEGALCVILLCFIAQARLGAALAEHPSRRTALRDVSTVAIGALIAAGTASPALADNPPSPNGPSTMGVPGVSTIRAQPEYDGQWSPTKLETTLGKKRIQATELSPVQQAPFTDQELYYPPFLFGSWKVTATLKQKTYPYGKFYVPSNSLIEGSPRNRQEQVGSTTSYETHYFSNIENQVTVPMGKGSSKSKIISDRGFNAIAISRAYNQLTPIQEVDWNPNKDPTRLSISFGAQPLAEDMRPLGPRRGEVYITARQAEFMSDNIYACSERSRSVTLVTRNAIVSDTESITEFRQVSPNKVEATNRIAVYLTPNPNSQEGFLWQQLGGKAVAFFDYDVVMERIVVAASNEDDQEEEVQRTCVKTPKNVAQCSQV